MVWFVNHLNLVWTRTRPEVRGSGSGTGPTWTFNGGSGSARACVEQAGSQYSGPPWQGRPMLSWDNDWLGKPRVVVSNTNNTHGKPCGQSPPARSNDLKLGLSREANKPSSAALVGRSKIITHSVAGMLLTLCCCLTTSSYLLETGEFQVLWYICLHTSLYIPILRG